VVGTLIDDGGSVGVTLAPSDLAVLKVVPGGADLLSGVHTMDAANVAIDSSATNSAMTAGCFHESRIRFNAEAASKFRRRPG
jgi:hypothetical protein